MLIDWQLYQDRQQALRRGLSIWLDELADVNQREGDFDTLPRSDRGGIGDILA